MDHPPSLPRTMATKLAMTLVWIVLAVAVRPLFHDTYNLDPDFVANNGLLVRLGFLLASLFMYRTKFYTTWTLADLICNASGMGYNGKDAKGNHRWDALSNIDIWNIETSTSFKVYLDNWNKGTTLWLRHVCYDRAPSHNMNLTFVLSALWHGLYPGYWVTFLTATVCVATGRKIRGSVRPWFQLSASRQVFYAVVTWLGTHLGMDLMAYPHVILDWPQIWQFHRSFYFMLHISVFTLYILLPNKKKTTTSASAVTTTTKTPVEHTDGSHTNTTTTPLPNHVHDSTSWKNVKSSNRLDNGDHHMTTIASKHGLTNTQSLTISHNGHTVDTNSGKVGNGVSLSLGENDTTELSPLKQRSRNIDKGDYSSS